VTSLLERLRIPYRLVEHPPVFTVAESMEHLDKEVPVKNLLLVEKGNGRKLLVIMSGVQRLDTKRLAELVGCRKLSFADSELLMATLGVTPGAVSLFGILHPGSAGVEVVLDEDLLRAPELGFHPGENTATVFMPAAGVVPVIEACGHTYHTLRLY
jgi:Ala-tRNA(Pro) deacylase